MSIEASSWAIEQIEGLDHPPQRLLLLILANVADEQGYCFPGVNYLARKVGLSHRMVRRHLAQLEGDGLISRAFRVEAKGQEVNDYFLALPRRDAAGSITRRRDRTTNRRATGPTGQPAGGLTAADLLRRDG